MINPPRTFILFGAAGLILGCGMQNYFSGPSRTGPDFSTSIPSPSASHSPRNTPSQTVTITPSHTPTATPIAEYKMEIPADVVWFNTKVALLAGQNMEIEASGKSNISGVPGNSIWEPQGDQGYCPSDCLLPGAGYGTLIGKFPGKLPFKVGAFLKMEIEADAVLMLAINDNEPYYWDNTGSYSVRIVIWEHRPSGE